MTTRRCASALLLLLHSQVHSNKSQTFLRTIKSNLWLCRVQHTQGSAMMRWEEEKREDGVKWNFLEHKGPVFAPPYDPLPDHIKFEYDGKAMKLSQDAEEIACFYAKMLNNDYCTKQIFNDNFFSDWRKAMTSREREKITKLKHCDFSKMHAYFQGISEKNKSRTKEEKAALKAENEALMKEYGFCTIDGHKEKIGNFRIEPPGLFRGRGEHPKMGLVKRRVMPEDILINCSKNSKVPQAPPGHKWREVKHDNTVTWLASWTENVQGQVKYVMLNPSSKLKGEKDWQKYETARRLHKHIDKIRNTYKEEWKSKEMRIRQRGVALYFIDKLALRAGNEKDEDQADTVGCCSLRVEHIALHKTMGDKENVVVFDFLGKDSIRYYNEVEVEKRVFKNLELFKENKKEGDDLFDRLNTVVMNEHLRDLMDGLTAKVFRTYNASWTLQTQLNEMTDPNSSIPEKLLSYNRANRAVAILCNHQRAVPKSHEKSMENLKEKIRVKREQLDDLEVEVKDAVKAAKRGSMKEKMQADKKKKQLERCREQMTKLELQETDRDENKTIALGTSKLNYLDPRISVAWCKKHGVPIDKIYNKTQRDKFRWAIDMATEDYHF
ncbi:DNA topoisomerase 1 isoform X3 [Bradysia coprophila]|uniref:DNA topoisomerase 1 isoform X3 n=1 Tax=Bradysia coprophila TaxID=38358 RepID=UPI00187DD60A|nr:DNA topoisomerase 1 isoform X3 [Bradysia coprophila]